MSKLAKINNALAIVKESDKVGRLDIQGEIGFSWYEDITDAKSFSKAVDALGPVSLIELHINSPGGSVFDGIAMYNKLVQHPAIVHTYIDGVAASIASVLAMAGDKVYMPSNTMMFVHDPWMYTAGNADELRKDAAMLDTMGTAIVNSYLRHLKGSSDQVAALMKAETWMTAEEAANTFNNVSVLAQKKEVTASLDMHKLGKNIPKEAKAFIYEKEEPSENIIDKVIKCLNRRGFDKAAASVREDLLKMNDKETQPEEKNMTPEEIAALEARILNQTKEAIAPTVSEAVTASLIAAKLIPDPDAKVDVDAPIAFEGDPSKPEDVQAHLDKISAAKAVKIMASGDEKAIKEHMASLAPKNPAASTLRQPVGNVSTSYIPGDEEQEQKKVDAKDTVSLMVGLMPAR